GQIGDSKDGRRPWLHHGYTPVSPAPTRFHQLQAINSHAFPASAAGKRPGQDKYPVGRNIRRGAGNAGGGGAGEGGGGGRGGGGRRGRAGRRPASRASGVSA